MCETLSVPLLVVDVDCERLALVVKDAERVDEVDRESDAVREDENDPVAEPEDVCDTDAENDDDGVDVGDMEDEPVCDVLNELVCVQDTERDVVFESVSGRDNDNVVVEDIVAVNDSVSELLKEELQEQLAL